MAWNPAYGPSSGHAARAYAAVEVETGVGSADPHGLVLMLYDGALRCLSEAQGHIRAKDIAATNRSLSQALRILEEGLCASLDEAAGGEMATRLKALYRYMQRRVLLANLRRDPVPLEEVAGLLRDLRGAWKEIGK